MFLDVSGTLDFMYGMSDSQRRALGNRVRRRRRRVYGSKSAAYRAAGVNAATWDRVEAGDPVREDRLLAVLQALWPDVDDFEALASEAPEEEAAALVTEVAATMRTLGSRIEQERSMLGGSVSDEEKLMQLEAIEALVVQVANLAEGIGGHEQEGGTHDDLADLDQKSDGGEVTPLRPEGTRQKAARKADVPDKED